MPPSFSIHRLTEMAFVLLVCLFGAWTVLCHVAVVGGISFTVIKFCSVIALASGAVAAWVCRPRPDAVEGGTESGAQGPATPPRAGVIVAAALATLGGAAWLIGLPTWLAWALLLISSLGVFYLSAQGRPATVEGAVASGRGSISETIVVAALCAAAAIATLVAHRPDADDAFYLNLVVTALDHPDRALLAQSGFWQTPGVPVWLSLYQSHSFEPLVALLSSHTGLSHKAIYYLVLPPVFAVFAVLVHWRLAAALFPARPLMVAAVWLACLTAFGETHYSYGNFAFVRMFQGKGILVSVVLPLCLLFALRYFRQPSWRGAFLLLAAMVSATGISSTGVAVAPSIVGLVLVAHIAANGFHLRTVAGALPALAYALAIGLLIIFTLGPDGPRLQVTPDHNLKGPSVEAPVRLALGHGLLAPLALVAFVLGPLAMRKSRHRRTFAAFTLAVTLLLLNPWLTEIATRFALVDIAWRVFWGIPMMLSLAIGIVAVGSLVDRASRTLPATLVAASLSANLLAISQQWSFSRTNRVRFGSPMYKASILEHGIVDAMVRRLKGRPLLYLTEALSIWLTTFRRHPYPLTARLLYFSSLGVKARLGLPEVHRRRRLMFILNRTPAATEWPFFQRQVMRDRPPVIAFSPWSKPPPGVQAWLGRQGYTLKYIHNYGIWTLRQTAASDG